MNTKLKITVGLVIAVVSIILIEYKIDQINQSKYSTKTVEVVAVPANTSEAVVSSKKHKVLIPMGNIKRVTLNDEVNELTIAPILTAIAEANQAQEPLLIRIDSPGGSVLSGVKVLAAMDSSSVPIFTLNMGIAASMAAHIFMHGTKRFAADNSLLMFHPMSGGTQGTIYNNNANLTFFLRLEEKLDGYVADKVGLSRDTFTLKVLKNLFLEANDAVDQRFADSLMYDFDGDLSRSRPTLQLGKTTVVQPKPTNTPEPSKRPHQEM